MLNLCGIELCYRSSSSPGAAATAAGVAAAHAVDAAAARELFNSELVATLAVTDGVDVDDVTIACAALAEFLVLLVYHDVQRR